jgi:hypothetical protein
VNNGGQAFCQNLTGTIRFVKPQAVQIAEYWNADRSRAVEPAPAGLSFDAELGEGLRDALRGLLIQLRGVRSDRLLDCSKRPWSLSNFSSRIVSRDSGILVKASPLISHRSRPPTTTERVGKSIIAPGPKVETT